jgi:flavin reductase (DIM6/NTAB) family NADH-FMN oxidoreductase RutF
VDAVIGVGNTHGPEVDKFERFGLAPVDASKVDAPLTVSGRNQDYRRRLKRVNL